MAQGLIRRMIRVRQFQFFVWLVLFCWIPSGLHSAQPQPNGRDIYRKQCAKCHGRNGDGVKGKYDDALHGDWSIEKLTRFIDKSMPDDAPEKCKGPDAEAV